MKLSRRRGKHAVARILAIIDNRASIKACQASSGLFENEIRRRNIPIMGIFRGKAGVKGARSDKGYAHSQRRDARLQSERQSGLTQILRERGRGRHLRVRVERNEPRNLDWIAVEARAAVFDRDISFAQSRSVDNADQRASLLHQGDSDRPGAVSPRESARAIDRVDHQYEFLGQARGRIFGFLGKPPRVRQQSFEALLQKSIDEMIGFRDWRSAVLVRNRGAGLLAWPKEPERQCARTSDCVREGGDEAIRVGE